MDAAGTGDGRAVRAAARVTVYASYGKSWKFAHAFAAGSGGALARDEMPVPGPIAFYAKPRRPGHPDLLGRVLPQAIAEGRDWYYADNGYFRPPDGRGRGGFYSVTRNALQHDGDGRAGPARFHRLGLPVAPWRQDGTHVLVCPPGDFHAARLGLDADGWLQATLATLAAATDRPVRVRRKPPPGRGGAVLPVAADLDDCWAVVVHDSKIAIEAALAGVPVFADGAGTAAALGERDFRRIEAPRRGDREQVFWNLAANQWTLAEIRRGDCWRAIGRR